MGTFSFLIRSSFNYKPGNVSLYHFYTGMSTQTGWEPKEERRGVSAAINTKTERKGQGHSHNDLAPKRMTVKLINKYPPSGH